MCINKSIQTSLPQAVNQAEDNAIQEKIVEKQAKVFKMVRLFFKA